MNRRHDKLDDRWRFFTSGLRTWDQTASLLPSQRFLVRALTGHPELKRARRIVELGPGIGTVTRAILREAAADAQIYSFEIDRALVDAASAAIVDPRLRFVHGSAADIAELLPSLGCSEPVDVVISSLGMSLLGPELRSQIVGQITETLASDGIYVQYAYFHARIFVWSAAHGVSRFNIRRFLQPSFDSLSRHLVVANVPPAAVYTCRGPRRLEPPEAEREIPARRSASGS